MNENVGIKEIGLAIWGCKGGYSVFCNNNVIDVKSSVIRNTLKDIRSFIRLNASGVDFYALEFTDMYKVYTIYRSSNDSNGSSGAFIAVTVFVPHSLSIKNVRTLLEEIINAYFKEYIHPIFLSPLDGKYDNIAPFVKILDEHKQDVFPEKMKYIRNISTQDDIPQVLCYSDISLVDEYFATPYRKQFYACQEVMFLEDKICANLDKYGVLFGVPPTYIDEVSEPECSCLLPISSSTNGITFEVEINGEKMDNLEKNNPLSDEDEIKIVAKKDYYENYEFDGTVLEAIDKDVLVRAELNYKLRTDKIEFEPKKYLLEIIFENSDLPSSLKGSLQYRLIANDKSSKSIYSVYKNSSLFFEFKGNEIAKKYIASVKICNDEANGDERKNIYADFSNPIIPVNSLETELTGYIRGHAIQVYKFQLTEKSLDGFSVDCTVKTSRGKCNFSFFADKKRKLELFLPQSEAYDDADIYFKANGYRVKQNKKDGCDYLTFSPSTVHVGVYIPEKINTRMEISCFLEHEKEKEIAHYDAKNKECYFELPYKKWEGASWNFYINDVAYDYIMDGNLIIPNILFVTTTTGDIVKCKIKIDGEDSGIQNITLNTPILLPLKDGTDISLIDEDNYEVERIETSDYCRIDTIKKKTNSDEESSSTEQVSSSSNKTDNEVKDNVTFENCKGYYFIDKDGEEHELKGDNKISTENALIIYKKALRFMKRNEEMLVCTIPFPQDKYNEKTEIDQKNKEAGFNIVWNKDGNGYHIVREDTWMKKHKRLISALVLSMLLVTAGAYFYFSCIKEPEPVCVIILKAGEGTNIKELESSGFGETLRQNKDTITIKLYEMPEEVEESLGKANIFVKFEDEGDSTYSLKKLRILEEIKKELSKRGKEPFSVERDILTPGRVAFNNYGGVIVEIPNDSLKIKEGIQLAEIYPRYKSDLDALVWNTINKDDTTSLQEYIECFDAHEEEAKTKIGEERKKKQEQNKINEEIKKFLDVLSRLKKDDCSLSTVDVVEQAYKKLDRNLQNEVNKTIDVSFMLKCYKQFFTAQNPDFLVGSKQKELIRLVDQKSYFSLKQIKIMLNCYGAASKKATDRFKLIKDKVGMSFENAFNEAFNSGYVDEDCRLIEN